MYIPIIGSFFEAAGTIIDRYAMNKFKIDAKNYIFYGFLAILVIMLPFVYFILDVESGAYELRNIIIFAIIVVFSLIGNYLINFSLKRENLTELEPIRFMQPFFTILLAFMFFQDERDWRIIGLALIASLSLVFAHLKKNHIRYDKYAIATLFGSFFFGAELAISKFILPYYSSFSFYFLRCLFIFLLSIIVFGNKIKKIKLKASLWVLLSGVVWVAYRLLLYYGYSISGVVVTTIILMLGPVFIMLYAVLYKKEKMNWKQILSTIIILACVIGAIVLSA